MIIKQTQLPSLLVGGAFTLWPALQQGSGRFQSVARLKLSVHTGGLRAWGRRSDWLITTIAELGSQGQHAVICFVGQTPSAKVHTSETVRRVAFASRDSFWSPSGMVLSLQWSPCVAHHLVRWYLGEQLRRCLLLFSHRCLVEFSRSYVTCGNRRWGSWLFSNRNTKCKIVPCFSLRFCLQWKIVNFIEMDYLC